MIPGNALKIRLCAGGAFPLTGEAMTGITDIHCHILPKVDDGAASIKEAEKMLRAEYADGVRTIIATPHYRAGMFEPPMKLILHHYRGMRKVAEKVAPDLRLYLGCEYHSAEQMTEDLDKHRRPTMAGSAYVLVEFSNAHTFEKIRSRVYELAANGYQPIVAHVERYICMREKQERAEELVRLGAYLQINAGAVTGEQGLKIKRFCRKLMEADLVGFIASDAHGMKYRKPNLGVCAQYVSKKMGREYAERIFCRNPQNILEKYRERKTDEGD